MKLNHPQFFSFCFIQQSSKRQNLKYNFIVVLANTSGSSSALSSHTSKSIQQTKSESDHLVPTAVQNPCLLPPAPHLRYLNCSLSTTAPPISVLLFIKISPQKRKICIFSLICQSSGDLYDPVHAMVYWMSSLPWWWCRDCSQSTELRPQNSQMRIAGQT